MTTTKESNETAGETIVISIETRRKQAAEDIAAAKKQLKEIDEMPGLDPPPEGPTVGELLDLTIFEFFKKHREVLDERNDAVCRSDPRERLAGNARNKIQQATLVLKQTAPTNLKKQLTKLEQRRLMFDNRLQHLEGIVAAGDELDRFEAALPRWRKGEVTVTEWKKYCAANEIPFGPMLKAMDVREATVGLPVEAVSLIRHRTNNAQVMRQKHVERIVAWGERRVAELRGKRQQVDEARAELCRAEAAAAQIDHQMEQIRRDIMTP